MTADKPAGTQRYFFRVDLFHRIVHGVLMASFLGLAASGMPLRFSHAQWARGLARAVGGFAAVLFFHKFFAFVLTAVFAVHIGHILYRALVLREAGIFWGPESMVPRPKDVIDFVRHTRWFVGFGERPSFDRFTYWEKFDYWAVFWGMAIIGTSGYMLWFSSFFARLFPGWVFNIALLIHAEEALLAVWFIFAIHFFNSHLRPEKFPMDLVIFTGRVTEEELRAERPEEYERLKLTGGLEAIEADPPPRWLRNFGRLVGLSAIAAGFLLFGLTLLSFVRH